jgi:hypothetical protein
MDEIVILSQLKKYTRKKGEFDITWLHKTCGFASYGSKLGDGKMIKRNIKSVNYRGLLLV